MRSENVTENRFQTSRERNVLAFERGYRPIWSFHDETLRSGNDPNPRSRRLGLLGAINFRDNDPAYAWLLRWRPVAADTTTAPHLCTDTPANVKVTHQVRQPAGVDGL